MKREKSFTYTIFISTTPEKLWSALTEGEHTKQYFFGREVKSEWKEGASVLFLRKGGELDVKGEVLKAEPYKLLVITWNHPEGKTEEATQVTYRLDQWNETVKFTLLHEHLTKEDFAEESKTFKGLNNGWPAILSNLKSYLETGNTMTPMDI
ncbi:SRPBCC family protein [Thalassobacillus pellis]|uniref:SRPBCC family protein n=1 Tax=Thalassobacillus pellis TaxID=748008 RepID=UPI0019614BAB|nr:SRPBCC family protein [Thalassobacillus pellis]MBM7553566.1 uncharacterized protein YndB with AHSA1/START domain [Thalassobacillus pellis]